ncbi:MAG: ABC transporter permease [Syntrophaceae bacterium]|nr:ABC transporter permease [Syntrophaceae bacterium]
MNRLIAILRKEFLVLGRDRVSLMVLFFLPAVFILIMSLAMGELFSGHSRVWIPVMVVNGDEGPRGAALVEILKQAGPFEIRTGAAGTDPVEVKRLLKSGEIRFACLVRKDFSAAVAARNGREAPGSIHLIMDPTVHRQAQELFRTAVLGAVGKVRLAAFLEGIGPLLDVAGVDRAALADRTASAGDPAVAVSYVAGDAKKSQVPNAVQQSVPSWIVFAVFFIVLPIGNAFIAERTQGTFSRLAGMNVSFGLLLMGKTVPYFLVNQIQVAAMLAVGVWVVPLLGGTALSLGNSPAGLALVSASLSLCAIAMALLVAALGRTPEQASTVGGILNLLLGAMGGVMVPVFVMPRTLQVLSNLSPMSWGLQGYLDLFLRGGGVRDVLPEAALLLACAAVFLVAAFAVLRRKAGRGGFA